MWFAVVLFVAVAASDTTPRCSNDSSAPARILAELPRGYILSSERQSSWNSQVGTLRAMIYPEVEDILFAGGTDRKVQFWKYDAQTKSTTLFAGADSGGSVSALAYIPGAESAIAVGREDGNMRFLKVSDKTIIGEVVENDKQGVITAVEFMSYDDDMASNEEVATASTSPTVKVWDVKTRTMVRSFTGHSQPVLALRFVSELEVLVSGGFDGLVIFWSMPLVTQVAAGKRCMGTKAYLQTAYRVKDCYQAVVDQGLGPFFLYGGDTGITANSCEVEEGPCDQLQDADYTLYRIEQPELWKLAGHQGAVRALETIPDLGYVASGGDDGKVRIWDPIKGTSVQTLEVGGLDRVLSLFYAASMRILLVGTTERLIHFDVMTGKFLKSQPVDTEVVALAYLSTYQLVATPGGAKGLSATGDAGARIDFWYGVEPCPDGQRPQSEALCELCPNNLAGKDGLCQIPCPSGSASNWNRTACEPCRPGSAGINGFCILCAPGRSQNRPGRLSCLQCRKGLAQPLRGQIACAECVDNTVAEVVGQSRCNECRDGTEPSSDHTRCQECREGSAGKRGVCFQCADGQQPSSDLSFCMPCPTGLAGVRGECTLCRDGSQPTLDSTECKTCPEAFAGSKGLCVRCGRGQRPEPSAEFCMNCPTGEAGTNGTCSPCDPGFVPITDRTACRDCPNGQPSENGLCAPCDDGDEPTPNRTTCMLCQRGFAGVGGICNLCPVGLEASPDQSQCVPCLKTDAAALGVCATCFDGFEPNQDQSDCRHCPIGRAAKGGLCEECYDGTQQDSNKSFCELCPFGTAGVGGRCYTCDHPLLQSPDRTVCLLRTLPIYYMFAETKCSAHARCVSNFPHATGDFCCPTTEGDLLECCEFESVESAAAWEGLSKGLAGIVDLFASMMFLGPALGILLLAPICVYLYRVSFSDDWQDWREDFIYSSRFLLIFILVMAPLMIIVLPWVFVTMLLGVWVIVPITAGYSKLFYFLTSVTAVKHYSRPLAMRRLRWWLVLLFITNVITDATMFFHDWMMLHGLLCSVFNLATRLIMPLSFEQVVRLVPFANGMTSFFDILVVFLRVPQVMMQTIVVHIYIHAGFTVTLLVAGGSSLILSCTCYILLVCDVYGRLGAARQSIMLAYMPGKRKVRFLCLLAIVDFFTMLFLHFSALSSAIMLPLVLQLAADQDALTMDLTPLSLWIFVLFVQGVVICMWVSVCAGIHLDAPPHVVARFVQHISKLHFRKTKREQFLIRAILQGLDLEQREDMSPVGSPKSPSSPRSPMSMSPRSLSPRKGDESPGSGDGSRSPGSRSPGRPSSPGGMHSPGGSSARGGGSSGRGGRPKVVKKEDVGKILKNYGSVKRLMREYDTTGGDGDTARGQHSGRNAIFNLSATIVSSARGSPRKSGRMSGRSGRVSNRANAQAQGGLKRSAVNFVRLPNGVHVNLDGEQTMAQITEAMSARGGTSARGTVSGADNLSTTSPRSNISPAGLRSPTGLKRSSTGRTSASSNSGASPGSSRPSQNSKDLSRRRRIMRRLIRCCCRSTTFETHRQMRNQLKHKQVLDINKLDLSEYGHQSIADLDFSPQQLYDKIPVPPVTFTCRRFVKDFRRAVRSCFFSSCGQWSEPRNVGPLQIRTRTRDLSRDVWRQTIDATDYLMTERATARTIAACTLWLPGLAFLWAIGMYCNSPPLKQVDDSLDILQHKVDEYVEKGKTYKEAVLTLKRFLVGQGVARRKMVLPWIRRCERASRLLQFISLLCLLILSGMVSASNAEIILPPTAVVVGMCVLIRALIDYLIMPNLALSREVEASTRAESHEEKKMREDIDEVLGSDTTSVTEDSSSEYSSANESFLDEDPHSHSSPTVLGVRSARVVVRPKNARLRLRFQLQQSMPSCDSHLRQWRREDPTKYGRLLQTPNMFLAGRLKRSHSFSFTPTEGSDWAIKADQCQAAFRHKGPLDDGELNETWAFLENVQRTHPRQLGPTEDSEAFWHTRGASEAFWPAKVAKFRFKRSHSLGTITARELPEWRAVHDPGYGWSDIIEERFGSGLPGLPADVEMPPRGLVDEFEVQGVFRDVEDTEAVSNKQMFFSNPWKETKTADRVAKVAKFLGGPEIEVKPWNTSFDEELAKYGGEGVAGAELSALRLAKLLELREAARLAAEEAALAELADHEGAGQKVTKVQETRTSTAHRRVAKRM